MAKAKTVWGIDIGQCALKALKLSQQEGEVQVEAFDIIEHAKVLSQPDADRKELVRTALEQFLSRHNVRGSQVIIAVPGATSFTRFVKLPPVEPKKIPDIVAFEAEQQIPFPIGEVIWRWQKFEDPDSPDVEVGIFAMKRIDVAAMLDHFTGVAMSVDLVQMAPLSLYNFMMYDNQFSPEGATLLADVGADKTDLVVTDKARMWTRTVQIGGNSFTEALVRSFKLSFTKAEKLKRTAATSKYARQIFQAMRPVFADLVQEIQRSIGFYTTLHRETRFKRLVGLGNGFRLPGLQKYLEQNLNIPVARIDTYNRLSPSSSVNAATFTENALSFAVSYGLALQGLGLARVNTNLLPAEIARSRRWAKKRPWFAASAAVLLISMAGPVWRAYADRTVLLPAATPPGMAEAKRVEDDLTRLVREYEDLRNKGFTEEKQIEALMQLYGYHDYWPCVLNMISKSVESFATHQPNFDNPDPNAQARMLAAVAAIPRDQRRMVVIEKLSATYMPNVLDRAAVGLHKNEAAAAPAGGASKRGFKLLLTGRTPLPLSQANTELRQMLRHGQQVAEEKTDGQPSPFTVVDYDVVEWLGIGEPAAGAAAPPPAETAATKPSGPKLPDPMFPTEDMSKDTRFTICWVVSIDNDGLPDVTDANQPVK